MKVARLNEIGQPLVVGTAERPVPGAKDVLVKVTACCIVPNAHNMIKHDHAPAFLLPELPCVFGLDAAGVVEAVGDHVFDLKPGDRVYVDPFLTCGTCTFCRQGRKDLCINACLRGYFAQSESGAKMLTHYPVGALSQYVLSPDANIVLLPPSVSIATASRLGYIGTSYGALKKGNAGPGKTVLIHGVTGTLGYAAVAIALGLGCTKILGIGRNLDRLKDVGNFAPDRVKTFSTESDDDVCQWVAKETQNLGVDVLYDCLGNGGDVTITRKLVQTVKKGGRAILVAGGAPGEISQEYSEIMSHDVAVLGSLWFSSAEVDELVALMGAGVVDFSFLQHETYALQQVNDAFERAGSRPGGAVNIVVDPHA